MELTPYVEKLRAELAVAAETGGEEARALAERLAVPLESAIRLTLLEALSAAADEITRELAPGSVEVRLRGLNPAFVVNTRQSPPDEHSPAPAAAPAWDDTAGEKGATARINLRLPDELKTRIDEAAARERLSANAWLVRAAAAALDAGAAPRPAARPGGTDLGQRYTGWAR
ncbi:toxin-antitoxin system HicB family antitoxin [Catellatospora vulcania]|uniref:toxin-antitoxin system HicB family antitoxin n=1 Tax=Catellatospora vulcania TaxID=1460450 RepID=UPI0012D39321|nr:toxin-antitoxin system HicB family antitoxin [Catellatospora vulcania]